MPEYFLYPFLIALAVQAEPEFQTIIANIQEL